MAEELDEMFEVKTVEKATTPDDPKEFTEEDITLVSFGLNPEYVGQFEGKNAIWQGTPTNKFIEYYVDTCTPKELTYIELRKLSDTQQELVKERLAKQPEQATNYTSEGDKIKNLQAKLRQTEKGRDMFKEKMVKYKTSLIEIIKIFQAQNVEADLTETTFEIIKELMEEL